MPGALLLALAWMTATGPAQSQTGLATVGGVGAPGSSWTTDRYGAFYHQSVSGETFSSSAVGDITGDGRPEIVAGYPDGNIYAWDTGGRRVLKFFTGPGAVQSSPTLVDINGDGVADVLTANTAGDVVAVTGTGKVVFKQHDNCKSFCGIFGTPTVADLNQDGKRQVVASSWDQYVYAWNLDGSMAPGFPYFTGDTIWSSPSLGDIDGDGWVEIIVGGDCDGVQGQRCYPQRGGYVFAIRHDGKAQPGWPRFIPNQVVWSSPAITDLDGNGSQDVVVGTGTMMDGGHLVYALDGAGRDLPGWPAPTGGRVMGSPAIGDINADGKNDVVVPAEDGRIYAFDRGGRLLPGWPQCNANNRGACPVTLHGSVALADIDSDNRLDVVAGGEQWMRVFAGDGKLKFEGGTKSGTTPLTAPPTVASIDGKAWIVQTASFVEGNSPSLGAVWVWTTGKPLGPAPWPTFKQNMARTGTAIALPTVGRPEGGGAAPAKAPPRASPPRARGRAGPTAAPGNATTTVTEESTTSTTEESTTTTEVASGPRRLSDDDGGRSLSPIAAGAAIASLATVGGALFRRWRMGGLTP